MDCLRSNSVFFTHSSSVLSLWKNTIVSYSFIYTLAISLSIGVLFFFFCKSYKVKNSTAFLICTFSWIIFSILGGLPFYFSLDISFINAVFEGTSGFTTTGTSILKDISNLPPSLLVWRSLMQWLGGLGIIAFFYPFITVYLVHIDYTKQKVPKSTLLDLFLDLSIHFGYSFLFMSQEL